MVADLVAAAIWADLVVVRISAVSAVARILVALAAAIWVDRSEAFMWAGSVPATISEDLVALFAPVASVAIPISGGSAVITSALLTPRTFTSMQCITSTGSRPDT